ncbi:MAG: hypothetical protein FWD57_13195 [Polyangiaceae bacterium]|nr:hypothetical protein [Polyangiaceae bacterium]
MRWVGGVIVALLLMCLATVDALAKATYACPYSMAQTYSAALRLLRVDNGFAVTERDPDAAYILFEYASRESGNRVTPGAIEIVPSGDSVMVIVKLPQMPRYHEEVLLDGLKRKLETEYGEPPKKAKPKPEPAPAPSGSADAGTGSRPGGGR